MRVGVVGAGKLGTVLARRAVTAGHEVFVAGRPGASQTALILEVMVPGATALPVAQWSDIDVVVLAVPLSVALGIDLPVPAGTVVVDATNYWSTVDGDLPALVGRTSSEVVAERHPALRWARSLNHLGYHDLEEGHASTADVPSPAIAIASDDPTAREVTARLVSSLGFEPVLIGPLRRGAVLDAGGPVFGAVMDASEMRAAIAAADAGPSGRP